MKRNKRMGVIGLLALGFTGAGVFAFTQPTAEVIGAGSWAPSGIKTAQYQLSGAMTRAWTNLPVASVTSASGIDVTINQLGVTFLAVTTEDNAGNTAIDMEVVVIGEGTNSISPIKKIEYELTGASTQGWTTYSSPFKVTQEGVTKINVRIEDSAGNIGTLSRDVKVDKTAPINNGVTVTLQ